MVLTHGAYQICKPIGTIYHRKSTAVFQQTVGSGAEIADGTMHLTPGNVHGGNRIFSAAVSLHVGRIGVDQIQLLLAADLPYITAENIHIDTLAGEKVEKKVRITEIPLVPPSNKECGKIKKVRPAGVALLCYRDEIT